MCALRNDAVRRGHHYFDQTRLIQLPAALEYAKAHVFTRQGARDKNGLSADTRNPPAILGQIHDISLLHISGFQLGACLSIPREPRWQGEGADARRAAPAVAGTTVKPRNAADAPPLPTPRERADFPSFVVVASSLGLDPTASAPPRLRGNLPRSRPRRILRQAPKFDYPPAPRTCRSRARRCSSASPILISKPRGTGT